MIRRVITILAMSLLVGAAGASADHLEKGDVEIQFRFSYNNLDFDGPGGDSENTEIFASFGYMLSDHHELGAGIGYTDFGSSELAFGGSYTYNFRAGTDLNPYVSALVLGFGGDLGDIFDLGYGVELGLKVYPWKHGGGVFGVAYREFDGSGGVPDATQTFAFGGLTLKL